MLRFALKVLYRIISLCSKGKNPNYIAILRLNFQCTEKVTKRRNTGELVSFCFTRALTYIIYMYEDNEGGLQIAKSKKKPRMFHVISQSEVTSNYKAGQLI